MATDLSRTLFANHVGERFKILHARGSLDAELTDISAPHPERPRPFSLLFLAPLEPVLPQAVYRFEHDRLDAFDLFIVPLGPDGEGRHMRYEAVFN